MAIDDFGFFLVFWFEEKFSPVSWAEGHVLVVAILDASVFGGLVLIRLGLEVVGFIVGLLLVSPLSVFIFLVGLELEVVLSL